MARKKPADVFVLDLADFQVSNIDFYASIQDRLRRVGEEFSTFAQALWGKQVSNFLDSSPGNDQMDNSWQPVRALGKGGFGLVGLWEKTNRKGVVVDSIAIKEMERHPNGGYHLESRPHLAREAVIMKQLNDAEQGHGWRTKNNILRLRSFKYFPSCSRWRFYLEYAPNGDLHKLIYSYRAWDTYLPEEFLWHVFHSLAKVAVVMEQGPFTDLETEEASVGQMIHLDVKPDNLYMGKPDNMALFAKYPTIKMADFGLSELTFEDDQDNPQMYRKGTTDYLPPEQTCFTAYWQQRPDGISHDRALYTAGECKNVEKGMQNPGYKFLSAHNIWGFGKLMYDMMTLSWSYDLDERMDRSTTEARYYHEYNEHAIPEIRTKKNPEYSSSLRTLIRECLHIKIGKRPTPEQLLERTQRGLEAAVRSRRLDAEDDDGPRVYHMGHEINHMPVGDAGLSMHRYDFVALRNEHFPDPAWQPLLSARWASAVRNGNLINQPVEEGGPKRGRPPLKATVRHDPRPLDARANPHGVKWKLRPLASEKVGPGDNGDDDDVDDDRQRDLEYQKEIGERIRNTGPHDTQELIPNPDNGDAARPRNASEDTRTSLERATDHLIAMAREMAHPRNVPPVQGPRLRLNPPKTPPDHQPRSTRKRRRAMGLSIDENFEEAEGHVVEGHNLRKRRR